LRDLLKAYLQIGTLPKAAPLAEKLLTVHNDPEGLFLLAEASARLGQYHEALDVYTRHADRLLATDSSKLLGSLHTMITQVRDDAGALELLLLLLNKAGESTHVNEVTELLAHASVKNGDLARARDLYQMLSTTEPQNQLAPAELSAGGGAAWRERRLALESRPEEGAVIVEELEATAPVIDQSYPDQVAIAVRSAVTDADLFLSYNLPDKAVVPLLGALPQAPRDARLEPASGRLHTRFHRFTEAAVCCRTLESVYHDAGYPDEAVRYGELAARYEQTAETAPPTAGTLAETALSASAASAGAASSAISSASAFPAAAPTPAPWPTASTAPEPEMAVTAHPEFAVEEMAVQADTHSAPSVPSADVASEWEDSLAVDETAEEAAEVHAPATELSAVTAGAAEANAANNPEIAETVEEVRFYLEHFMTDQARAGIEKLEALTKDAGILDPLRAAVAAAGQPAAEPEEEIAEINADDPAEFTVPIETESAMDAAPDAAPEMTVAPSQQTNDEIEDQVHHAPAAPEHAPVPAYAEAAPAEAAHAEPGELSALVADLEASLGDSFPEAPPIAAHAPAVEAAPPSPATQPLQSWPVAPPKKRAPATPAAPTPEAAPIAKTTAVKDDDKSRSSASAGNRRGRTRRCQPGNDLQPFVPARFGSRTPRPCIPPTASIFRRCLAS
jgi:tetratricopeptide (TPR) repeat protein